MDQIQESTRELPVGSLNNDEENNQQMEQQHESSTPVGSTDETCELMESDELAKLRSRVAELEDIVAQIKSTQTLDQTISGHEEESSDFGALHNVHHDSFSSLVDEYEHDLKRRKLSPDTFGFLLFAPIKSLPFLWAMLVFCLQILVFTLVAVDSIDTGDTNNPLGIPPNVDLVVRVTQIVAIVVAVVTQQDLWTALNLLFDGYRGTNLIQRFDGASAPKWAFAVCCRFLEGALGLVVTFFLIVRESTVIDLLLNFTAMEFVSQLDDCAFFFAKEGYVGRSNRIAALRVANTTYSMKQLRGHRIQRMLILLLILGVMLGAWGYIFRQQQSGKYLCDELFIQFGDDALQLLGAFSGLYDIVTSSKRGFAPFRATYVERMSGRAQIGYCNSVGAWTFAFAVDSTNSTANSIDPCDWAARSPQTDSYDVTTVATEQWIARSAASRKVNIQHHKLLCFDCNDDLCGEHGSCSGSSGCVCDAGYFGLRCEFEYPCSSVAVDSRNEPFRGTRVWSTHYKTFLDESSEMVEVYHHPVYINESSAGTFDIIMFTGRRWVVTFTDQVFQNQVDNYDLNTTSGLAEYLRGFHAFYSSYRVSFFSDPVDVGAPTDQASPVGLQWYDTELGRQTADANLLPINTDLLCSVCNNNTNPCLYDGVCRDGVCSCSRGSSGVVCEVPAVGNGRCDSFFNTDIYNLDGGDCCESTCLSSATFLCGKDDTGFVDIGYFFCQQDSRLWTQNSVPVVADETYSQSGWSVALSGNGKILAIGEPGASTVRLFDKLGSEWIQRGPPLLGPEGFVFGLNVAVSKGATHIVANPTTLPRVVLAIGGVSASDGTIFRVYDCRTDRCNQLGDDMKSETSKFSYTISTSRTGAVVAESGAKVYDWNTTGQEWTQRASIPVTENVEVDLFARYVSLSGRGDVVAIGSLDRDPSSRFFTLITRVYTWVDTFWAPRGGVVERSIHSPQDATTADLPRSSLSLSDDSLVLAIGSHFGDPPASGTKVFEWTGSVWKQRGSLISGLDDDDGAGWSVSLSLDGSVVAVGTNDVGSSIRMFRWNGTEYEQLQNVVPGGSKSDVAVSDSGSIAAVGLPLLRNGGTTTTYEFLSHQRCENEKSLLRLSLTMDEFPEETFWELVDSSGDVLLAGSPYLDSYSDQVLLVERFTSFVQDTCVHVDECTLLYVYHQNEIGISPPGGFTVFLDGEKIASGGNIDTKFERLPVGNCGCKNEQSSLLVAVTIDTVSQATSWDIADDSGQILLSGGPYNLVGSSQTFVRETCASKDVCATLSIRDEVGSGTGLSFSVLFDGEVVVQGEELGSFQFGNCPL